MSMREHLQFLVLMIPTILIVVAAAVSMAGMSSPKAPEQYAAAEAAVEL